VTRGPLPAIALVAGASLVWALVDTLADLFGDSYSAEQVVWSRYCFHLVLLFGFVCVRGSARRTVQTARPVRQVVRGLLMLGMPACFIVAATRLSAGLLWSEFWTAPLLILCFAWPLLAERPSVRHWAVALIAFGGVVLMNRVGDDGLRWAELLPLGMAACFGAYVLLSRQLGDEPLPTSLFYTAICVFVPLTLLLPRFGRLPNLHDAALMAAIGALGLVFLWAVDRACQRTDVSVLAPYFYLEPIWLMLLRLPLFDETPGRGKLVGAAIVCLALAAGPAAGRLRPALLRRASHSTDSQHPANLQPSRGI
jgi:drug/metabolite transporter (DMT)-like permease